jgi:hypothetical protein
MVGPPSSSKHIEEDRAVSHAPHSTEEHRPVETTPTNPASVLLRIFWLLAGYIVIAILALFISQSEGTTMLSLMDPALWLVAALMIAARYVDITRYGGATSDGQPATLVHWRRYALLVLAVAAVSWLGAHAVQLYS